MQVANNNHDLRITSSRRLLYGLLSGLLAACSGDSEPLAGNAAAAPGPANVAAAPTSVAARGFVLSHFTFVLPGASDTDCEAFNLSERDELIASLDEAERAVFQENPNAYFAQHLKLYFDNPQEDPCANPAAFETQRLHTIEGPLRLSRMTAQGVPSLHESPAPNTCPADGFDAGAASRPIDNQFWRVVGCTRGYQPGDQIQQIAEVNIRNGSRTILLEIAPPAEPGSDTVEVGIYSGVDPIPTGAANALLPRASLGVTDKTRYHNRTRGSLRDGVLTTGPFDLRLELSGQRVDSEYYIRDARLYLELQEDGTATGRLAGFYDLDMFFDGFMRYQDKTGRSSGGGGADTLGYQCPSLYRALNDLADGHPDPDTGACSSISIQFEVEAIPAFLVWPENTVATDVNAKEESTH